MIIKEQSTAKIIDLCLQEDLNILLVAEGTGVDVEGLIQAANESNKKIIGGLFPKVLYDEEALDEGIILKTMKTTQEVCLIKDMSAVQALPDMHADTRSSLVLVDGLSAHIPDFLESLYDKYWNKISYVGGGCGSLTLVQKPCIFTNDGFYENAAVVVFTGVQTHLGVKHGWEKIDGPFVANKTEGNKVIELNWRPAFEVYREVVEANTTQRFESSDFFDIAKGFPFGIFREGQEDIVRDPIAVEEDGTLVCVGKVESNTSLNILKGDTQTLIANANIAAKQAINDKMEDLLVTDCISRILYMEDDFQEELRTIKKELPANQRDFKVEGILSIGEISSGVNGYLEFYNKTIVVSTFS